MPKVNSFYGLSLGKLYIATFFCFFALVAYLFKDKEKMPRKFSVCVAFAIIQKDIFALSLFCLFVC